MMDSMVAGRGQGVAGEGSSTAVVEIVFCATTRGVARLDCVVAAGAKEGWPFSMQVLLPFHPALSAVAERMLMRWSDGCVPVSVDLRTKRHPMAVRLCDGTASILLDVASAGSVFS